MLITLVFPFFPGFFLDLHRFSSHPPTYSSRHFQWPTHYPCRRRCFHPSRPAVNRWRHHCRHPGRCDSPQWPWRYCPVEGSTTWVTRGGPRWPARFFSVAKGGETHHLKWHMWWIYGIFPWDFDGRYRTNNWFWYVFVDVPQKLWVALMEIVSFSSGIWGYPISRQAHLCIEKTCHKPPSHWCYQRQGTVDSHRTGSRDGRRLPLVLQYLQSGSWIKHPDVEVSRKIQKFISTP